MNKYHIFISYTNREEEVRKIKPLIREYRYALMEWANQNDIEIYYDDFSMERHQYTESELKRIISKAIKDSDQMTAFLSDGYVSSPWCRFEWLESTNKHNPIRHGIMWKNITLDLPLFGLLERNLFPEKFTDATNLSIEPTTEILQAVVEICVEDSKQIIHQHFGL